MRVMFFSQMDYFKGEVSGHSHRLNCNLGEDNKSKYIVAQKRINWRLQKQIWDLFNGDKRLQFVYVGTLQGASFTI